MSGLPETDRELALATLSASEIIRLAHDWQVWARDDQLAPVSPADTKPWQTWLILGGRGSGKTRAGADFGTPPDTLTIRICQLGEPYGRGASATAVL